MKRAQPPSIEKALDINRRFRTESESRLRTLTTSRSSERLTVRVAHVDEVKADDVVTGVTTSRIGLVQAVDVEAGGENRPDAQNLGNKLSLAKDHLSVGRILCYQRVEPNVPGAFLQVSVECMVDDGFLIPW
jgi:hypothetical protein